ncbi:RHNO1 protein, partial [Columbina picui]|nr:RHNO1 protein [Columbina picui]
MPPKKKHTHKSRKAELVFLERPQEGPVHCYETPLRSAENPRRVPTKPVDRSTSAAWVCPQFETTKSVVLKACGPHKRQNQDVNHSLFHAGGVCQRATACTFPSLSFKNPDRYAVHPHPLDHPDHPKNTQRSHSQPKKGTTAKANIQVNSLENCSEIPLLPASQPVEPEVYSLPDVDTPQVPSMTNWRCSSTLQLSSHAWHPEKELAFGIDSCGRGESAAILVTDTPEHEYGVKVTWRQRPHLMKYLQERG